MKRMLLFLSVAAVLASCDSNDRVSAVMPADEAGLIRFGVSDLPVTRAVNESTAETVAASGFNVAAIVGEAVYFNEKAVKSGNAYYTEGKYYYPQSAAIDFYACHPVEYAISVSDNKPSVVYEQDNVSDLIVASRTGIISHTGDVELVFDHVLSQLNFTAKGTDPAVDYILKSVSVKAPDGGVYSYVDGTWVRGTLADVEFFSGELQIMPEGTAVADAMTFLPGDIQLSVSWECRADGQLVGSYSKSTPVCGDEDAIRIEPGKNNTINLLLPNADAVGISFNIQVNTWESTAQDVILN